MGEVHISDFVSFAQHLKLNGEAESERHMDKVRPGTGREGGLGHVTSESW